MKTMPIKTPRNRKWEKSENLNQLLLFAQTLEEKLFNFTIDSFRARALNIHVSIQEMLALSSRAVNGNISTGTLNYALEEFIEQLEKDPVLTKAERAGLSSFIQPLKTAIATPKDFLQITRALEIEIGGFYFARLLTEIENEIIAGSNQNRLIMLADSFICECELYGFNRGYLFIETQKFFWKSAISESASIKEFLHKFETQEAEYKVIIKGTKSFLKLKDLALPFRFEILDSAPPINANTKNLESFIERTKDYPAFLVFNKIKSRDPLSARLRAEKALETVTNTCSFVVHHEELEWHQVGACFSNDAFEGFIKPPTQPMKRCLRGDIIEQKDEIRKIFEVISGHHFKKNDEGLFFKVLSYHNAALKTETTENQLIDLWAALEGFLPSSNKEAKITHYIKTILPSLTLSYTTKIFSYISNSLQAHEESRAFIEASMPEIDFLLACTAILTCTDLQTEKDNLLLITSNNPLLKARCNFISQQFSSADACNASINSHRSRASRHLQRIYSTRNLIVHDAESLPYLSTLVENLHSYVDTLIWSVLEVGTKAASRTSAHSVIQLLEISEKAYLANLDAPKKTADRPCTLENHQGIIFGRTNPLSPINHGFSLITEKRLRPN